MQPPINEPIRCVHCDYDLRGLADAGPRCPECGCITTRAEYERHLSSRGVNLSKHAVHAGFLILPILVFAAFCTISSLGVVSSILLLVFTVAWIYQAVRFFMACGWSLKLLFIFLWVQFAMLACVAVCVLCTPAIVLVSGAIIQWNARLQPVSWSQTIGVTLLVVMGVMLAVSILIYVTLLSFQWAFRARSRLAELVSRQLLDRAMDR